MPVIIPIDNKIVKTIVVHNNKKNLLFLIIIYQPNNLKKIHQIFIKM
jgi:hypothetical protein